MASIPQSHFNRPSARSQEEKSDWDFFSPSDKLTVATVFALNRKYELHLLRGSGPQAMQNVMIKGEEPDVKVWWAEVPRLLLKNEPARLAISFTETRWFVKSSQKEAVGDKEIVDNHRYGYMFYFSPSFIESDIQSNVRSPSSQFLYLVEYLIQSPNYQSTIPQLVLQYISCESQSSVKKRTVYKCVERVFHLHENSLCVGFAGCVFAVLGSLQFAESAPQSLGCVEALLSYVNEAFVRQLTLCPFLEFVSAVVKGAAHCLFDGTPVPEEVKQIAINHLLRCEKAAADFLDKALQTVEKIERSQLNQWIEVIKKQNDIRLHVRNLLMKVVGCSSVFRVLQCFGFFSLENSDDLKFLKQVLENAIRVDYYSKYKVEAAEIEEILDVLSTGPDWLRDFFHQSPLPGIIKNKLENPSNSDLSLYTRLFVTQYDYKLLGKIKKSYFLQRLCEVQDVPFSYVANELQPDEGEVVTLFEKWLKVNCARSNSSRAGRSEISNMIRKIDSELRKLWNNSYIPTLSNIAIDFFSKMFPLIPGNLKSLVNSIENVKTERFKLAYVSHESVLSCLRSDRSQEFLLTLLQEIDENGGSFTVERLLEYLLEISQALTYEEVEASLVGQREIERSWILLMKWFWKYKNYRLAANLQQLIQMFSAKVQTRHLSISKFLQLNAKAPEELQTICQLIVYAGEAENLKKAILENMQEALDSSVAIGAKIALLQQFSTEVITDTADRAALLEDVNHLQMSYQETLLEAFQITPMLQELLTNMESVKQFVYSGLFKAEIAQAQKVKPIAIANFQAICIQAINSILTTVSNILESLAEKKMAEVLKVFGTVEDWQKEIDLLMTAKSEWRLKFFYLSEGLKYYRDRKKLQKHCNNMLRLKTAQDPATVTVAERYVQAIARAEEMLFGDLVLMHRETASTLYPKGDSEASFSVLGKLQDASELTRFLEELSEERLKHLLECVNDYDESTVTAQLIFQLETVWHFFNEVRSGHTCSQLVSMVGKKLQMPEFKDIENDIHVCSFNVRAFMELSLELEKKEEAKKNQIDAFFKSSKLSFSKKDDSYVVSAWYSKRQNVPLNLPYLQELKDRASLSLHAANFKEEDSSHLILHAFVDFVNEIQRTVETLIALYEYGYPIDIAHGKLFNCLEGNFQELSEFQQRATEFLQKWKDSIESAYLRCYPLTFLFGTQFWTLEDHLYGLSGESDKEAVSLLTYMHRVAEDMLQREVVPEPAERLHCLGQLLEGLPTLEAKPLHIQYKAPVKANIKIPPRCVLYISVPPDRVLHALVSAYLHSGRPFPQAHQVIYCARRTQWAELQAFLYRCFTSPQEEMFTLIECEKLPLELQTAMRTLFAKLVASSAGKDHFSLAVITGEDNSLLAEYFQLLENPKCVRVRSEQVLCDENILGQLIRQVNFIACGSSTVVVRSETAGQGKTVWVQEQAEALHLPLRKFPIAGELDLEIICRQLLEAVRPESVLLLILSHVNSPEVLNDLLTCVCLLRTVRAGSLLVSLPLSCRVFVEVQNLQPPLLLPFLNHFTQEVIKFDIKRFKLTKESRMVVAYLCLYEMNALARENVSEVQVTTEMAVSLLTKYFLDPQTKRGQQHSFLAVRSFISVVSALLVGMEQSPFNSAMIELMISDAAAAGVPQLKQEYENLRANIVNSFLQTCEEVTTRCVAQVLYVQGRALENVTEAPALQCTLTWDQSNHFSMIFHSDGSHVAIYRKQEHVPASLKKLIYVQSNCHSRDGPTLMQHIARNQFQITDYTNLTHLQALAYLQTYAKTENDLTKQLSDSSYVMTQDNFLKMNLIYLRAIAKLPIVIMGETGCGKTSLIRFFVKNVLCERLEVVNIHAGVTSKVLAARINEIIQLANESFETRLWVFFDEFNTSDCVGQICEMLCERTFRGEELPPNIVLLAACNPYRLRPPQLTEDNVGIKKSLRYRARTQQNLMHVVKPLPESVIEYIWDFGALTDNDSRKYIETMLKQMKRTQNEKLFSGLIYESQKYFHQLEDVSSVSLRDVARFVILYQWFEESLKARKSMRNNDRFQQNCLKYQLKSDWPVLENEEFCAGILALCNCYYYRLARQDQRLNYLETMCRQANGQLRVEIIEAVLRCNEDDFIARMDLPDATALNQAFRENLSCIMHCIFCRIALFICGKPGCSKSLAVQLVFSNLRGAKSVDPYFRTLPELVMVPFQGSGSCTSEGIQKVFDRAKRFLSSESMNLLPVVVFDEIGLAEISKHNPLKVLHSLLELENRRVGFVGVSNWRLDASKMNRAMYLARPDPDCEQLKFTARSIFLACKQQTCIKAQIELVEVLAVAYFNYKEELRGTRDADFFGLRDFYSMIKQTSYLLIAKNVTDPEATFRIVKYSVERNFGGKVDAALRMLQLIMKYRPEFQQFKYLPPTPTIELINGNLNDTRARFLMLICKGDVATYAIDRYIKLPQMESRTLVGSHMREDEGGEEYAFRSLSDMILYMEKGISVILKDMDHVYTSLYDLFNQNFAVCGDRRYCRVALGAQFNPRCFVHSDFHVLVFMSDDYDVLEQTDAPFLNRFEKHQFDIDQVFKQQHTESYEKLLGWTESLTTLANGKAPLISLNHSFPLYSPEYLKLLVLFHDSDQSIVKTCKEELLQMASQEVVLLAHAGGMEPEEKAYIQEAWKLYHNKSFLSHVSAFCLSQEPGSKSKSLVFLYNTDMLQREQLSQLPVPAYYQHFSSFRRELDAEEDLVKFYRGPDQLYILDFNLSKDGAHFVMIKFVVEKISKKMKDSLKKICLLVRLMRNVPIDIEVCWFDQWDIRTFTSSCEQDLVFSDELVRESLSDIVLKHSFYDFEAGLGKLTLEAYQTIAFKTGDIERSGEEVNNYIFSMSEQVVACPCLVDALREKLLSLLPKKQWLDEVLCQPECVTRAPNIPTAIRCTVELALAAVYPNVLYAVENVSAFRSFFTQTESEFLQQVWLRMFKALNCDVRLQLLKQRNRLDFGLKLDFPFVKKDYDMLGDIFAKSRKYSADQSQAHFFNKYFERSILKNYFKDVNRSPALQRIYLQDLIRIDLQQKQLARNESLLMLLHNCWSCDKPTIEGKVLSYMQNRDFSIALCEVISVLQDLEIEGVTAISTRLAEFSQQYQLIEDGENAVTSARSMLNTEIRAAISKITTSSDWLGNKKSPQTTALLLNRLFNWINCLNSLHGFFLENFDEIDILALCFQVLSRSPQAKESQLQLQKSAASVTDGHFLYNDAFSQQLITIIQSQCSADDTQRVLSVYLYKLLIWNDLLYLPIVAAQINHDEGKLWKHSSLLVSEVARIAGLNPDEWKLVMKIEQSPFTDELERLLAEEALYKRFSVLLCDVDYWYMKMMMRFDSAKEAAAVVSKYYKDFQQFIRAMADSHISYPCIMKVHSSAFMRCYLEAYCKVVHEEISLPPNSEVQRVSNELNSDWFPTARVYVLKYWKHSEKLSMPRLKQSLHQRSQLPWVHHFTFPEQHNEAVPCTQDQYYQRVSQWTAAMLDGEEIEPLTDIVNAANTIEDTVAFATAMMMNAYVPLAKGQVNDALEYALQKATELIQQKFGKAMNRLIGCFVKNFPQESCMRLSPQTSVEDKYRALPLCYALIILCANARVCSPLTFLFLDKYGNVRQDLITVLNRSYLCGVGCNPLYSWLQKLRDDFETLKSTTVNRQNYKGSANKCSCGYVYIINNCGGPMEKQPCPFCREPIGGMNHSWVKRPGHENLTDQEAMNFMAQSIAQYKLTPETGYCAFDSGDSASQSLRGMAPLAHSALHLLIVLLLRFLNLCKLLSDTDLQAIIKLNQTTSSPADHLEEQIRKDFDNIKRTLNTEDSHLWWYSVLMQFSEFMRRYACLPTDLATRTYLETQFNEFLQPFCQCPVEIVKLQKESSIGGGTNALSLLNETGLQEQLPTFPLLHLFRLTQNPDIFSLSTVLELQQLKEQYPLLSLYLQLKEDVAKLPLLSPLIEFTNYMRNCFDHRIKREDARFMRLTDVFRSDRKAKKLFKKCSNVWTWLSKSSVSYNCHKLPPKQFTSSDELIFFLADEHEKGCGMYMSAALLKLADIQNTVMNGFLEVMKRKLKLDRRQIIDERKIPIQELKPENVVHYSLESLNDLQASFLNNPAYGEGREIVYNFPRFEEQIQSSFEKGRLLIGKLNFICYQFEMLSNYTNLITSIRKHIAQLPFDSVQIATIENFLSKQEHDTPEMHHQELTSYYESLNFMLCFLRNAPMRPDMTLLEYAQKVNKFKVCEAFTQQTTLSLVRMEQIVALYELLECWLFPYSVTFVKSDFKKPVEKVSEFLNNLDFSGTRPFGELQLVVMRLIIRLLIADIDPKKEMAPYVARPDFWSQSCKEEEIDWFKTCLATLPLAHALQVYYFFEKRVKDSHAVSENLQLPKTATPQRSARGRGR